jgi:hypothetical protein
VLTPDTALWLGHYTGTGSRAITDVHRAVTAPVVYCVAD